MSDEGQLERRIVSVVFADLVGFTPLSERLDAEDVAAIQDAYFAAVRETVTRYGGRLEKFIGDAAVAAFGLPRSRDDDAERAARAGLAIVHAVEQLAARLGLAPDELRVRVGIQTGEVVHMTAGPDAGRMTGDTVNTAARLQTAAPPGGVLLGESTALAIADIAEVDAVEPLTLKGKAEQVRVCVLTGFRPERSRDAAMGRLVAPTIGRDAERARLRDALDRLGARTSGTERWMVSAPPGVGKTRLLREVAHEAETRGVPVARVRIRHEPEAPFAAVADLVRSVAGSDARPGPDLRDRLERGGLDDLRLGFVAEELGRVLDPSATRSTPAADRDARFEAWLDGLDALGGQAPSVWLIEDLHWAAPDLVAFVLAAGDHEGPPRLLVATTRPSLIERAPSCAVEEVSRGRRFLELRPLPAADAAALATHLVGGALPGSLLERIAERADGNPLFIEELLRGWVSAGTLVLAEHGWHLTLDPDEIPLPTTVQAIYAAQLDDLPDAARQAARRASVSGRRFPVDALPALDVRDADEAVDVLVRRAIVGPADPDPVGGPTVTYRHALLRDAGYASLARAERAVLHLRLARWLEATAGERAADIGAAIGTHWELAASNAPVLATEIGDGIDRAAAKAIAARWLEQGAASATQLAAYEAAGDLLRRAIALTSEDEPVELARRLTALGDVERLADLEPAAVTYQRAVDLLAPLVGGDRTVRSAYARAARRLAEVHLERLDFDASDAAAAAAQEVLGPEPDADRIRIDLARNRSIVALDNDFAAALARAEALLAAARATGDPEIVRMATEDRVGAAHEADQATPDDWLPVIEAARQVGDIDAEISGATNRAMLLLTVDPRAVAAAVDEIVPVVEARRRREDGCWLDYVRAEAGLVLGDWDAVLEIGQRVIDVGERHHFDRVVVRTMFSLVPVAGRRGEVEVLRRAAAWFDARRGLFPNSPYGLLNHGAADVHFRRAGLLPDASPDLDELRAGLSLGESGPATLTSMETVVDDWIERGELDTAATAIETMDAAGTARDRFGGVVVPLLRLRLAARLDGADADAAREVAEAALRIPFPWWAARALRVVEAVSPDPADAGAAAAQAASIERGLGLREQMNAPAGEPVGA